MLKLPNKNSQSFLFFHFSPSIQQISIEQPEGSGECGRLRYKELHRQDCWFCWHSKGAHNNKITTATVFFSSSLWMENLTFTIVLLLLLQLPERRQKEFIGWGEENSGNTVTRRRKFIASPVNSSLSSQYRPKPNLLFSAVPISNTSDSLEDPSRRPFVWETLIMEGEVCSSVLHTNTSVQRWGKSNDMT